MSITNYKHEITDFAGRRCLIIEDLNQGGRSLTNSIEEVVTEICVFAKEDPCDLMIVYKDSEGVWDGWDHRNKEFVALTCENQWHAIRRYIKKQLQP